jgi:hypothetical protein
MHDNHPAEHASELGFWGLLVAWIKYFPNRDATIEELLGKHTVHVCSGEHCGFGSITHNGVKNHLHTHKSGRADAIKAELRPDIVVGIKGDCSDEREKPTNDDDAPETWPQEETSMNVAQRNTVGKFWLKKFRKSIKRGISMRHPTRAEAKRIQDGGELAVCIAATVLPLYQRFAGCDFDAKEGAMEYCWYLIRKKVGELCDLTGIDTPRKAPTPKQTAVKLTANQKARVEWELMKTIEAIMEEINWRVTDNRLQDEPRSLHDIGCLAIECDRRRDKLYKPVKRLTVTFEEESPSRNPVVRSSIRK